MDWRESRVAARTKCWSTCSIRMRARSASVPMSMRPESPRRACDGDRSWTRSAHGVHEDRPCRLLPPAGCFPVPGEAISLLLSAEVPQQTQERAPPVPAHGASTITKPPTPASTLKKRLDVCPLLRHRAESGARRGSDQSHGTCRGTRPSFLRVAISLKMAREATHVCAKNGRACLLGPSLSLHPCLPAGD